MSSTWRELTATVFALDSFLPLLKGSYIKWFSDSQNACRIIRVESMRKDLHVIALKIFQFCVDNGIELEMQWIPRTKLDRADFISRINQFRYIIIHRTIQYLYTSKAVATLVVPFWPSSYFWPIIGRNFFSFVMDYVLFSGRTVLKHGQNTNSLLGSKRFFGQILAVRMKF